MGGLVRRHRYRVKHRPQSPDGPRSQAGRLAVGPTAKRSGWVLPVCETFAARASQAPFRPGRMGRLCRPIRGFFCKNSRIPLTLPDRQEQRPARRSVCPIGMLTRISGPCTFQRRPAEPKGFGIFREHEGSANSQGGEHGVGAQGVREPWADGTHLRLSGGLLSTRTDAIGNAAT